MTINRAMDKDVVHITQPLKKKEVMPFTATWIDLESVILNEVSQKRRNIVLYPLYVESEINDANELTYKTKRDSQT